MIIFSQATKALRPMQAWTVEICESNHFDYSKYRLILRAVYENAYFWLQSRITYF